MRISISSILAWLKLDEWPARTGKYCAGAHDVDARALALRLFG
jgi:hypothetical protein